MSILQSILLGIIQGLTEFLPISSSAHLVLIPHILGWDLPDTFVFDVLVQVASLAAVIIYFWRDLTGIAIAWINGLVKGKPFSTPLSRMGWLLILATIPAGIAGLILQDYVEAAFDKPVQTSIELWITAGLLLIAERVGKRNRKAEDLRPAEALWIGAAQAIAIFPGISRSGATIAGGMSRDLERPEATRFAFLMSVPIMAAAGLLSGLDLVSTPGLSRLLPTYIPGFLVSAVVSYISIRWLLRFLAHHSLRIFAIYCFLFGSLGLVVSLVRSL